MMLRAERLKALMATHGLSQSELARRVGVTQTTIRKLVTGAGYGSKHLHRIARVLDTTPEYLTGETDDPRSDSPVAPVISPEMRELSDRFALLTAGDRRTILHLVRSLSRTVSVPTETAPILPSENALTRMFEGLLETIDPKEQRSQQALLLAKRLPSGLSLLRGLAPESPPRPGRSPALAEARSDRATPHRAPT